MITDFELPLSEHSNIVFRPDRYDTSLFEIAKLKPDGESYAYNAVRFKKEKVEDLYSLLMKGLFLPKNPSPFVSTQINGTTVRIVNYLGEFNTEYKTYKFTYTEWDGSEKYDFRVWYNNYTECDKGMRLTEDECFNLALFLKRNFDCKIK